VKHNITATAVDDLLIILKVYDKDCPVPKCSKTLLKTPQRYDIVEIQGGSYYHFGLENQLKFFDYHQLIYVSLHLKIGIDCVPITRSGRKQFWPILGIISSVNNSKPFLIVLFFGENRKPGSVSESLTPFETFVRLP